MGELSGWRYCPRCRTELAGDETRLECPACALVTYANAAPTASALVLANGRVLLSRRRDEPFAGRWDVPGGFLQEDEHPLDALRRELAEETGLTIEADRFLGVWIDDYADRKTLNLYWTARVTGGEAKAADDVSELRWFEPGELPGPEELAFRTIADVLAAFRNEQP